jgi:ABC-type glycerol-3-phosphate transport system substrate-binding protein
VLNTTVQHYREQLIAWNPEFADPNFPIIKGQQRTLEALRRFAEQNQAHIYVRFVWWGQAFDELRAITEGKQSAVQDGVRIAPDIAQVGSTWVGYFAKKQALIPRDSTSDRLNWRDAPDTAGASLRYTTDVRLIFYWKRRSYPMTGNAFTLDSTSWDTILSSLDRRPLEPGRLNPPMVMPIALTTNLLHDYVPLVWAGGGRFLGLDSNQADLTSDAALAVPLKLMDRAVQPGEQRSRHRIIAFPEMSHEEAVQHFFDGEYLALIEPIGFIKRWKDVIARNGLPKSFFQDQQKNAGSIPVNFWDYAGVAAPPRTFIGGSDLIVTSRVKEKPEERDAAFKLVRFLATDEKYSATLAELGTLPAQQQKFGIDTLSSSLKDNPGSPSRGSNQTGATDFAVALSLALSRRSEQEYPALAEWPDYLESREVLEAIQRIWRRIGLGKEGEEDVANLKEAAAEAQLAINQHLNWRTKLWQDIQQSWWAIVIGMSALLAITINQLRLQRAKLQALGRAARAEKGKHLALRLYQARMHDLTKIYGSNFAESADGVKRAINSLPNPTEQVHAECQRKLDALKNYGQYVATVFTHNSSRITIAICEEMENPVKPTLIQEIVTRAYEGAKMEFKAVYALDAPVVSLNAHRSLDGWSLSELPTSMEVAILEWFFNCLKAVTEASAQEPKIEVQVEENARQLFLCILSPVPVPEEKRKIISEPPSLHLGSSSQGLPLIRDILWYGFESKATCENLPTGQALLSIPIKLTRSV